MFTLFIALACFGQGPELAIQRSEIDLGHVAQGETVSATIDFENIGSEQLTISDIKTSCGCTAAKLEKKQYQPGEKGQVQVTLKTAKLQGDVSRSVTLYAEGDSLGRVVTLKANVTAATTAQAD